MLNTIWGVIHQGKVELLEQTMLPEGTKLLVTILSDNEEEFWLRASRSSLDLIWNNEEDDVYAELLKA